MRALCRRYVELCELQHYENQLLASRRWSLVRCEPQPDGSGGSPHIFNVYGVAS